MQKKQKKQTKNKNGFALKHYEIFLKGFKPNIRSCKIINVKYFLCLPQKYPKIKPTI